MAKRKNIPIGQVNKSNRQTLQNLKKLMEDLGQKYSIKVGILNPQQVKDSKLNTAELGAIHEFGAKVNVTDEMRNYLNSQGVNLKDDTKNLDIPARPFLRPLLDKKNKETLLDATFITNNSELNKLHAETMLEKDSKFLENIANTIGDTAVLMVQHAFNTGGFPKQWEPVKNFGDKNTANKPLIGSGQLKNSIEYKVKKT